MPLSLSVGSPLPSYRRNRHPVGEREFLKVAVDELPEIGVPLDSRRKLRVGLHFHVAGEERLSVLRRLRFRPFTLGGRSDGDSARGVALNFV